MTTSASSSFVNIGERTNVTGSAAFKKLILADDYTAAVEVARQQVENGAQVIDVNMDEGLLDAEYAMTTFLKLIAAEPDIARIPVMIDSSKWDVIEAGEALGRDLPIMLSMTLTDLSGRNLSGHTVEAFWHAVRHARPLTIGLNCSFGATQLRPHVKSLSEIADTLIMVYPNAGLPNELGEYDELPDTTAGLVGEWAEHAQVNILGGCCGSTPAHIAAIAKAVEGLPARQIPEVAVRTRLAGLEPFTMAA